MYISTCMYVCFVCERVCVHTRYAYTGVCDKEAKGRERKEGREGREGRG
jgi:hypothetical protein